LAWLGVPHGIALILQGLVALGVALVTVWAWRKPGPLPLKVGLAVLGTLIATPYDFNYDLVLLAIPIAALASVSRRHRLPVGTKLAIGLAALAPSPLQALAQSTHLQLTPLAILLMFWAVWRAYAATLSPIEGVGEGEADPATRSIRSAFRPQPARWRRPLWPA
jgi:hypothetical protein